MKFDIYSRKSKFTGKGESIENQIELCKQYIMREYPETKEEDIYIFEDEGFSAKNLNRPQFQQMIEHQKKVKIDYVVVYRLDRISRNVCDFSNLLEDFSRNNIGFISINEKFDTSTPMGRAMITIAAIFAQLERETIAERIRDNMHMLARTGRWLGGKTPLGYTSEKVEMISIDNKKRSLCKLTINPQEADIVKMIYQKFIEFQSLSKLESYLIKNDITSNNTYFTMVMIKNILTHPVYCIADKKSFEYISNLGCQMYCEESDCNGEYGFSTYNRTKSVNTKGAKQIRNKISDWIISVGKHEGIICSDDWIRVNKIIEQLKPCPMNNRNAYNSTALLSGSILRCGNCGSAMRPKVVTYYKNTEKENTFDYMCKLKERSRRSKCNCPNVHGNELDRKICEEIFKYKDANSIIGRQLAEYENSISLQNKVNNNNLEQLRKILVEKEQEIKTLIISMSKSSSDVVVQYAKKEIEKIDCSIQEIKKEIQQLESIADFNLIAKEKYDNLKQSFNEFERQFQMMTIAQKREILNALIDKIIWNENGTIDIFIKGILL